MHGIQVDLIADFGDMGLVFVCSVIVVGNRA